MQDIARSVLLDGKARKSALSGALRGKSTRNIMSREAASAASSHL